MSIRKTQWVSQPPSSAFVNTASPLTRDLAFLYSGIDPRKEIVSGITGILGDSTTRPITSVGAAIRPNGATSTSEIGVYFNRAPIRTSLSSGMGDFTIFVLCAPTASGSNQSVAIGQAGSIGQLYLVANSDASLGVSSGTMSFLTYDGVGALLTGTSNTSGIDGKFHLWVGVRSAGTLSIYRDGVFISSNADGGVPIADGSGTISLGGLVGYSTYNAVNPIALSGGFNRALSTQEITQLSLNPWQLFAPKKQILFVPVSAGGDATALGVIATATAAFLAGSATGEINATASGVTITATADLLAGSASGSTNATASGSILDATAAFLAGTATASSVASGIILDAVSVMIPGSASGSSAGTAPGALLEAISSFLAGTAAADSLAAGVTITATAEFLPGTASGGSNATVAGITASATATLLAGTASGEINATATGVIINAVSTLLGGSATGNIVGTSVPSDRIHISISISI